MMSKNTATKVIPSHPLDSPPTPSLVQPATPAFSTEMTAEQARALLIDITGALPPPPPSPPTTTRKKKEHNRKKKEGTWVRHKGSKSQRPKDSFQYVDYRKTPTFKMHKMLQKALKPQQPKDTDPVLKGRTWERLWENIPSHETTLALLQKLAGSQPHDTVQLLKYGSDILTLQNMLSLRKNNWLQSSVMSA
jgi:hypothetical protein